MDKQSTVSEGGVYGIVWVLLMILGFLVGGWWGLGLVIALPFILAVLL